jgi:protein involved in polysaccharide export with SLBB domain
MIRLGLLVGVLLIVLGSASAQDPGPGYILGADDVIEISDLNHPELNETVTVLPDGTITYSWVGQLPAAGKTPAALAGELAGKLSKSRNNVEVAVTVKEVHSRRARVLGAVKTSGPFDLKPHWRVLDLIAVAGGLTTRAARVKARVIRGGGAFSVDLERAASDPAGEDNPELVPDDLLLVDEQDPTENKVYAMGQVNKPGSYDLGDKGMSLLALLSQAGNTTDAAALTQAYVLRQGREIPLDLRPLVVEGRGAEGTIGFELLAGDVLMVPALEKRVAVMGQVNKPGFYPLPETRALTALDALSLAGGQTGSGDLARAGVVRMVNGAATVVPLDIEKMLKSGKMESNVVLDANDVLFIPSRTERKFTWNSVLAPLSALSYLGLRVFR